MITIKIDTQKFNEMACSMRNKYPKLLSKQTAKRSAIAAVLVGAMAGAGAVYAESPLYRQQQNAAVFNSHISASQAIDAAAQKVNGQVLSVDLEHKLGDAGMVSGMSGKYFEVEILTANGEKHKMQIDADSGALLADKVKPAKQTIQAALPISLKQAISIAQNQVQGSVVKDAELSDKSPSYKVELLQQNGVKQKVRVNAQTGAIEPAHAKHDQKSES